MAQTNRCPRRALSLVRAINMSFTCTVAVGRVWRGRARGRQRGQVEELNSQITEDLPFSTGNTLAINTNSLLRRTPWPINASDAETGNSDELSLTPLLGLMGQKGTRRASV